MDSYLWDWLFSSYFTSIHWELCVQCNTTCFITHASIHHLLGPSCHNTCLLTKSHCLLMEIKWISKFFCIYDVLTYEYLSSLNYVVTVCNQIIKVCLKNDIFYFISSLKTSCPSYSLSYVIVQFLFYSILHHELCQLVLMCMLLSSVQSVSQPFLYNIIQPFWIPFFAYRFDYKNCCLIRCESLLETSKMHYNNISLLKNECRWHGTT